MDQKHSIYYKYDAKTCVRLHYVFFILIDLIFGAGIMAALVILKNWLAFLVILVCWTPLRRIPGIMLGSVLYSDCDAVKMKDILYMIENKVKVEKARGIFRMLRVQATSFIDGCEQESFELLQTCGKYEKSAGYELFYLSLYMRHYSVTEDWENYGQVKVQINDLLATQKISKKNRIAYERYIKENEAREKILGGKFQEARDLYYKLLDDKKSNRLNRVIIHGWLGVIDLEEGKDESAKQHLLFAAQNGGTTYVAKRAEERLQNLEQE